jgi:hypothetical protein
LERCLQEAAFTLEPLSVNEDALRTYTSPEYEEVVFNSTLPVPNAGGDCMASFRGSYLSLI